MTTLKSILRTFTLFISFFVVLLCAFHANRVFAVVDTSSSELQSSINLIVPNGESLSTLYGYGAFDLKNSAQITNGIKANYEARLLSDPWFDDELPNLQILIYAYSSQDSAESAFDQILSMKSFSDGGKTILSSDSNTIFYSTKENDSYADVFSTINADYVSFHMIHKNGNLIFQSSLFRVDGEFNSVNLQTYAQMALDTDSIKDLLGDLISRSKTSLSILFPPSDAYFTALSESSSLNLNDFYTLPTHGLITLDLYVSSVSGATGTILDSSGISTPEEGDIYLYINGNGEILAGIYAPNFDADCDMDGGWYRLTSSSSVTPYEWNKISLHYGVGGFYLSLKDEILASCSVSQPRSENPVYLGDFPNDTILESFIGYADNISTDFSTTDFGETWDSVLTEQLFLDLPNTDSDLRMFQYLKERGVLIGSDGMLYPDRVLNRAEMVKIILRAFNRNPDAGNMVPFWDVPIDAWYRKYIAKAYDIGMVFGHTDLSFSPGDEINNAEFFTMLYRLRGSKRMEYEGVFADVFEEDWYALGAQFAYEKGLMNGENFNPNQTITRREAGKVLYNLMKSS